MREMAEDIDRSGLFDEIRQFSQRKLKKVETKVTTGSGEALVEKRNAKGVQSVKSEGIKGAGYVVDNKPDLQIGMIIPGIFIASQDVAADKTILDTYEITHILNLAYGVANSFEDDYNYKKIEILDVPETNIKTYFDECFEFIDEARHYGNCLVHCNAGVSRCTTVCTAYLMLKEKKSYTDALNLVREARPFSKPNAGFMKQLEEYNEELMGSEKIDKKSEDAFAARKRAEIEAEKAAISGVSSVKNKLKTFGGQLNAIFADRAKSISPMVLPLKKKPPNDSLNKVKLPELPAKPIPEPPKQPSKWKVETPKPKQEVKKLVINNDVNNRNVNDSQTSPSVDETPISVKNFRNKFESNKQNDIPKIQKIPATPQTNSVTHSNSPWNKESAQFQPQEDKKKKIIIRQRSKDVPEEQPKRRSTKDLAEAFERVNNSQNSSPTNSSPRNRSPTTDQKPYGRRRTTQLDSTINNTNSVVSKPVENNTPIRRRTPEYVRQSPPPPPPLPRESSPRIIKLNKQTPTSSATPSPQPPVSHSPSPARDRSDSISSQKMVFGRVRPPPMSLVGRTLSQASQNIQDVSNNDSRTDSGRSASNSRSESPVLSAVGKSDQFRDTKKAQNVSPNTAAKLSDNLVAKRTTVSSLKSDNISNKSSSPCSSSDVSDVEEVEKPAPKHKSMLSMKLNTNSNNNNKINKETDINQRNDSTLTKTQTKEPSIDNQSVKKVSLAETKDRQQSFDRKLEKSKSGLTRSSTAEILKLIKTKSRHDMGLARVDEDDEIESLLMGLEKEGIDNVDWDEMGVDYEEVKDIVDNAKTTDSDEDSSEESDSESDSDDEAVHMVINRQAPEQESETDDDFEVVEDEEEEESD